MPSRGKPREPLVIPIPTELPGAAGTKNAPWPPTVKPGRRPPARPEASLGVVRTGVIVAPAGAAAAASQGRRDERRRRRAQPPGCACSQDHRSTSASAPLLAHATNTAVGAPAVTRAPTSLLPLISGSPRAGPREVAVAGLYGHRLVAPEVRHLDRSAGDLGQRALAASCTSQIVPRTVAELYLPVCGTCPCRCPTACRAPPSGPSSSWSRRRRAPLSGAHCDRAI